MTYFHEEQQFRAWWIWVLLLFVDVPLLVVIAFARYTEGTLTGVLVAAFATALVFAAKLAVDVDRDEIRISFHFLWPKRRIPIANIRSARAQHYSPLVDYGGWGVRLSWKGWAFNVSGSEGVLVETNDGRRVMIGSRRPKELEAAIARAVAERSEPR